MIELIERQTKALSTYATIGSNATRDNHVDAAIMGQSEGLLHQSTIESFKRTCVIALFAHSKHESLYGQGTTLMDDCPHVGLRHLPCEGNA